MITLFLVRLRTGNIFRVQSIQHMSAMERHCLHGTLQLQDRSLPNITHSNENLNFPKQRKCNMFTTMYFSQHSFNSSKHSKTVWFFRRASDFFQGGWCLDSQPEPWASKQLLAFHPGNLTNHGVLVPKWKKKSLHLLYLLDMKHSHEFPTEVLFSFWCFLHCLLILLHLPQLLHDDSQLGLDFTENWAAPFSH